MKRSEAVWVLVAVSMPIAWTTLHACPGCSADVAANPGLTEGFTYATLALIAVPAIAAIAVWRSIRRVLRSAVAAENERTVTPFHDPDQD